ALNGWSDGLGDHVPARPPFRTLGGSRERRPTTLPHGYAGVIQGRFGPTRHRNEPEMRRQARDGFFTGTPDPDLSTATSRDHG
ncbi:MAG: hypothetical protein OXC54_06970, partial [Rhodospirillaceae bacterium]|nr:hypothetical protein [Rhodospirillaceae bacterium]